MEHICGIRAIKGRMIITGNIACKGSLSKGEDGTMGYITLGKNIRKYRLILGFTQEEFAGKCDCSNSHIGQIENASGIPSRGYGGEDCECAVCNSGSIAQGILLES